MKINKKEFLTKLITDLFKEHTVAVFIVFDIFSAILSSWLSFLLRFDGVIPADKIKSWLKKKPTLLYKNGHPRYTVVDLDHGTTRIWSNTVHHGIKAIWEGK